MNISSRVIFFVPNKSDGGLIDIYSYIYWLWKYWFVTLKSNKIMLYSIWSRGKKKKFWSAVFSNRIISKDKPLLKDFVKLLKRRDLNSTLFVLFVVYPNHIQNPSAAINVHVKYFKTISVHVKYFNFQHNKNILNVLSINNIR